MTNDVAERLLRLKTQIDTAKTTKAQSEGRLNELMRRLHTDFKCKTVQQARTRLQQLNTAVEELEQTIEDGLISLENKLG